MTNAEKIVEIIPDIFNLDQEELDSEGICCSFLKCPHKDDYRGDDPTEWPTCDETCKYWNFWEREFKNENNFTG